MNDQWNEKWIMWLNELLPDKFWNGPSDSPTDCQKSNDWWNDSIAECPTECLANWVTAWVSDRLTDLLISSGLTHRWTCAIMCIPYAEISYNVF